MSNFDSSGAIKTNPAANQATATLLGNNSGVNGPPVSLTAAQAKALLVLVKGDVGLGNVDNTSDASKPVSTATQTALNLKADLASPALTGNPTAPTASPGDNDTSIATTAFVAALGALKADLASPTFTGDPKAPTPSPGDNDTSIATTAFVATSYAPLASPALTGNPTAPTAAVNDSDTSIATTAFVNAEIANDAPNVTLTAVGASPNANGLTLTAQALNAELASASFPGMMTAAQFTKLANTTNTNSGDVTLGNVGASPNAKAATIAGQVVNLELANASFPGLMTAAGFTNLGNQSGTNTGNVTVGTVGASPNANALTLVGQAINAELASASFPGLVTAAQFTKLANTTNTNSGDVTLAAVGSSPNANGATLTGQALNLQPASTAQPGVMSALDKLKLDNLWIDVTANTIALVNPANSAATNVTNINLILTNAPNGSTIYFPHGLYQFNAAWTYPAATAKMFVFKGEGSNKAGSPATNFTELRWTANVGGDIITLPSSGNGWYTEFANLTFTSSATQSAGALVNVNGNVGTNFNDCSFQSVATGQTWFDVLNGSGGSSNSWNSAVINNCSFQGFTNSAIRVNSSGSSLVISNCVIQGQWGSTTQIAAACVSGGWVGALQIIACDILGGVNNLLLNPVTASSEVCASVQCTNTYFDFAGGSCIKVTGTGATVRCKWDTCTFTTSNAGAGSFSAVELAGSFVYAAGAQDLAFVNCNIYNTFAATGTTNGVLITNVADVSFVNCKVAGWTNGYNITPMASNKTNVQIIAGTCGPSGGFAGNSVGFLIAAGAYKGLQIRANNCLGNTTNLTLGAVTVLAGEASLFAITENAGINPRGTVTIPAVPGTGVVTTNITGFRVIIGYKTTGTIHTAFNINGVAFAAPNLQPITTLTYITLEPGGTITWTGGTAPTWVWVGQ